jgi:hypothetical protein
MNEINNKEEKIAIQEAILAYYHEGHAKFDPKLYANILHPEWKFFLFDQGELRIVDREEFYSWYSPENVEPELEWEKEFYSIDVTGDIAAVKLRLENQKVRYIDYLNLMKIHGRWWIVHKLSHDVQKP